MKKSSRKTTTNRIGRYSSRIGIATLLLTAVVVFASCSMFLPPDSEQDLADLAIFAQALDATVRHLAVDGDLDLLAAADSRTVSPDDDYALEDFETGKTPEQVYTAFKQGSETTVSVPKNNGVIADFYGNASLTASFTMTPAGANHYLVNLRVFDSADLLLEYVEENYYVSKTDWAPLSDTGGSSGFVSSKDVYYDGSELIHDEIEFSAGPDVYDIAVPDIVASPNAYTFTIRNDWPTPTLFEAETTYAAPAATLAGSYRSFKKSEGDLGASSSRAASSRSIYESYSYYAESAGGDQRDMVVFALQDILTSKGKTTDTFAKTVTRSSEVYDGGSFISKTINSVTQLAYRNDPWQITTVERTITKNGDDTVHYEESKGIYYSSTIDGSPDELQVMELDQQPGAGNESHYSGTLEVSWGGSWVQPYTVTYKDGNLKLKKGKGYNASRALVDTENAEISLDIDALEQGSSFSIDLPYGGRFTGTYTQGTLRGIYTYASGRQSNVSISNGSILVNEEEWTRGSLVRE